MVALISKPSALRVFVRDVQVEMFQENGGLVVLPGKPYMKPKNHPIEKENHLQQTSIFWFHVNLPGCIALFVGAVLPFLGILADKNLAKFRHSILEAL